MFTNNNFKPISYLKVITFEISSMVEEMEEQLNILMTVKDKPWIFDDDSIHSIFQMSSSQKEEISKYKIILEKWRGSRTMYKQERKILDLSNQLEDLEYLIEKTEKIIFDIKRNKPFRSPEK